MTLNRILKAPKKLLRALHFRVAPIAAAKAFGVSVGSDCRFIGIGEETFGSEPYLVSIGDHVTITAGVRFITHDGGVWVARDLHPDLDVILPIRIGNNVFIGLNCLLLPGVTVGNDVVIGAGSVVTRDIDEPGVYAGNPARRIRDIESYIDRVAQHDTGTKKLSRAEKEAALRRRFAG